MAKNFRYVSLSLGVGRYQPHAASDVLHNQYGDCKDKHTLLASLLEAEGLHAVFGADQLQPQARSRRSFALAVRPRHHHAAAQRRRNRRSLDGYHRRSRALPPACLHPAQQTGAGDSSGRTHRRRRPASGRDPGRHSHARHGSLRDRWQDQRHRQARSPRALRVSRRRRIDAALRFPPRARRPTGSASSKTSTPDWAETSPISRSAIRRRPASRSPCPTTSPR